MYTPELHTAASFLLKIALSTDHSSAELWGISQLVTDRSHDTATVAACLVSNLAIEEAYTRRRKPRLCAHLCIIMLVKEVRLSS